MATETPNQTSSDPATTLMALEGLIINYLNKIEAHQEKVNEFRESLNNVLENDPDYVAAAAEAKEATQKKSAAKNQIISQPEIAKINENYKDSTTQLKEMKAALSLHLQNYALQAGTNQFEDDQGQVREIIQVAKVVKRSNKFRS